MKYSLLFLFVFLGIHSFATDLHVSPSGLYGGTPCYTTIQGAINASANGDNVFVHAGKYYENITIDKSISLIGDNQSNTILMPAVSDVGDNLDSSGSEVGLHADLVLIKGVSNIFITNITFDGHNDNASFTHNGQNVNGVDIDVRNGIVVDPRVTYDYSNIDIDNVTIQNIYKRGVQLSCSNTPANGNFIQNTYFSNIEGTATSYGVFTYFTNATIQNNLMDHAGIGTQWGNSLSILNNNIANIAGGIMCYNGSNVVVDNNIIDNMVDGSIGIEMFNSQTMNSITNNFIEDCSYGIVASGSDKNMGVTISNNSINNAFSFSPTVSVGIFTTTEIEDYPAGKNMNTIIGTNGIQNAQTGIIIEASNAKRDVFQGTIQSVDNTASFTNNTTLSGVTFNTIFGNYIELHLQGANSHIPNIDATTNTFDSYTTSQADGFAIEDQILHKMDDPTLGANPNEGLVIINDKQLYVTRNQGNTSVQRAFNSAPADGWTINVKSGAPYAENVTVDKSANLDNDGSVVLNGVSMNGAGKILTLNKNFSLANTLDLTNGIIATAANKLMLQNGVVVTGGSDASHVKGNIEKTGNAAFVFPLGDGTSFKPCSISAPASATDAFLASYVNQSAKNITPGSITSAGSPAMLFVSSKEYWTINRTNGSSNVQVGLTWKDIATSGVKNNDADLVVSLNDGSGWSNLGATTSNALGFVWATSISSPTAYNIFSLGSTASATTLAPPVALPVKFIRFTAEQKDKAISLKWIVTDDQGMNENFKILRSNDGVHFTELSAASGVASGGNDQYAFMDMNPLPGMNYYQIRAIEESGKSLYSSVVYVNSGAQYFNVVCNGAQLVQMTKHPNATSITSIEVLDMSGREIYRSFVQAGKNETKINNIKTGTYVLYIMDAKGIVSASAKVYIQ